MGDSIVLGVLGNKKNLFIKEEVTEEEGEECAKSVWGLTTAKTDWENFITFKWCLIWFWNPDNAISDVQNKILTEEEKKEMCELKNEPKNYLKL